MNHFITSIIWQLIMFDSIINTIQDVTGLNPQAQKNILVTVIIILFLWITRLIILRIVWRRSENPRVRYLWKRALGYIIPTIGIILVGSVWIHAFGQVGTYIGLLSAGLAIALKDPLTNIAGWMFILIRKPFTVGDRVQLGNHAGDVIDIRLFQFTLMEIGNWVDADQSTGRIIHIPNSKVFTEAQANYSTGFRFIWNEIPVLVTFESNWEKAKSVLEDILKRTTEHLTKTAEKEVKDASKKFMIHYSYLTPIVYTSVLDSGVLLTMRYICDPQKRRGSEHKIWQEVLREFARHDDVDFAYPTQRLYYMGASRTGNKDFPPL